MLFNINTLEWDEEILAELKKDQIEELSKKLADEEEYETFVIPDNVGGRYSVLTAVGLLPIAVAGIDIDKLMKTLESKDYRDMPTAQSAQQCLKLLDKNWKSFFKSIKDWSKHTEKYLGKPKLPKYKKKDGRNILILTNCNCKLKEGYIKFPKIFNGFKLKTNISNNIQKESVWLAERVMNYYDVMSKPYITGKMLRDELGIKPGEYYKEILDLAHKMRLAGVSLEHQITQIVSESRKIVGRYEKGR